MATKSIAWTNGTGNITLTYTGQGDDTVVVTSDPNDLYVSRSQTITFKTTDNTVTRQVTVTQEAKVNPVVELSVHPVSYDSGYSAYSVSNLTRAYADSTNTTYAQINLTRGSNAETVIYYNFGSLNIPSGATIKSVTCTCKCSINTTSSSRVSSRKARLYAGSTAMGTAYNVPNSTTAFSISAGTWTAAQLNGGVKLRLYAMRGKSSTTSSYYFRFYGATLTVEYEV